jgi:hypothetical protein
MLANELAPKVLAIASGGGHWVQLMRLMPALHGVPTVFVSTLASHAADVSGHRFYAVADASRWDRLKMLLMSAQLLRIILLERPRVLVTTGAAPGYVALRIGKLLGARGVWIDSIANAEELSLSGRKAGKHADLWLTQWPHLAVPGGPRFEGAVL